MDFEKYFAAAANAPRISSADAAEILSSGHPGGEEKVARSYQRLVCSVVWKWRRNAGRYGIDVMDLVQDGNRGLLLAMRSYDAAKGVPFAAWAWDYIKSYVEKEFYAQLSVSRARGRKLVKSYLDEKERVGKTGGTVAPLDLRREIPFSALGPDYGVEWFYCGEDAAGGSSSVVDEFGIPESFSGGCRHAALVGNLLGALDKADGRIHPLAGKIIRMRYGIDRHAADGPQSLRCVASNLRLSKESVRKIEKHALDYLRVNVPRE